MKRKLLFAAILIAGALGGLKAADLPTSGSGEFFIKNVGTGTYLKGDAYWGTKAVVWDDPYAVTLTYLSDGVYTLQSQQNNGGQKQYITSGADPYVDGDACNLTFTEVDAVNHYYTINNGDGNLYAIEQTEDGATLYKVMAGDVTTDYAKWQIISRAELVAALDVASSSNPVDATFFIKDAGIDVKSVNAGSWSKTNVDLGGGGNAGHSAESWNKANFNLSQTVTGLPNGKYKVTCHGYYRYNVNGGGNDNSAAVTAHGNGSEVLNAIFFAGAKETPLMSVAGDDEATAFCTTMGWADNTPNNQWQAAACFTKGYYLNTLNDVVVTDGTLTLGVKKTTQAYTDWAVFDEFKLYYLGEDLSIYQDAYADAVTAANAIDQEAPMQGTVLTALQTALSNYGTGVDTESKDALLEATSALTTATSNATTSIEAYANANTALTGMYNIVDGTNFYTSEALSTFGYATKKAAYDGRTMETAAAAAMVNPEAITGWHAANDVDDLLVSAWDVEPEQWDNYHVNTWSTEGVSDGSNFKVPFIEYWTGDGDPLGAKTMTATISGLENGLYSVSAWVRVRAKNGTAATDATGITMQVTTGDAVDVTEGTQIGETQFQIKEYEAEGLVKDGTLTFKFIITDGTNVSWMSFKNVKYSKVRDLTPEEAAVAPTAIALYNGEDEVTSDIALDKTTTTVTLSPSYTPATATEGYISWTTSDASVATVSDGVVTAVSTGTATITVTSTLAPSVSASATINVTFPETEVAAYTNDGATRYVHNYGENLIKNGSFQYPNGYYGWTAGDGNAIISTNFDIVTDGENKYLKSKYHNGVGGAGSIGTGWPIENGKTYIFGYKAKAVNVGSAQFHVVSLANSVSTTETESLNTENERKEISVGTSWTDISYKFTNSNNYKYLQFRARWLGENGQLSSFDDFYLVEVEADDDVVGNVQYALDARPSSNIGTGAFQYSQDAIDAANALVQGTATVKNVEDAYDALTTLNAPATGKLYNVVNITSGFTHTGKALTFKSASDADLSGNTTSMAWETEPGSYLPQGVKFTAVAGTKNGYTLSYTRADGNVIYVSTGTKSGLGENNNQLRPTTDPDKALTFVVTSVGDNHWWLNNTTTGNNVGSDGSTGFYTAGGSNKDLRIQEAVNNEVSLNIKTENQYGTLILPFAADVPTGITAYSVSEASGNTLTLVEENAFEANTPYIVFAEEGATATLEGLGSAYTDASYTEGLLTGVYAATEAPVGTYVLQNNDSKVGFYQVAEGQEPTVGANRAYLTAPAQGGVKAFFFDDTATAIQNVFDGVAAGEVYDLAGRKLQKLQKGVNIVNGKKVIVK